MTKPAGPHCNVGPRLRFTDTNVYGTGSVEIMETSPVATKYPLICGYFTVRVVVCVCVCVLNVSVLFSVALSALCCGLRFTIPLAFTNDQ